MIITTAGKVIRVEANNISLIGRNTMGVRVINLEEGEAVGAIARVAEPVGGDDGANGNGTDGNGSEEGHSDSGSPETETPE